MNLEVVIRRDPERFRTWAIKRGAPPPTKAGIEKRCNDDHIKGGIITCFADVCDFADKIYEELNKKGGPYFFKICIRAPGKPFVEYEMPHGDMILADRLWIQIDMYEAFYVEVT